MHPHHRVLVEYGISPAEWAALSSTSYLVPLFPNELVTKAQLESEDNFSEMDIKLGVINCARRGWIIQHDDGIQLTEEGDRFKDQVSQELMETVELL